MNEMMTIRLTILVFLVLVLSCDTNQHGKKESDNLKPITDFEPVVSLVINKPEIINFVHEYISADSSTNKARVFNLVAERKNSRVCFTIESVNSYNVLMKHYLPIGVFSVDGNQIIMSMPTGGVFNFTQSEETAFKSKIEKMMNGDFFELNAGMKTYDPKIWAIELFSDSIAINRHAFSPSIPIGELGIKAPKIQ